MRIVLFILLAASEFLYILRIIDPTTTQFEEIVLMLMLLVSFIIRLILYLIGFAPRVTISKKLALTALENAIYSADGALKEDSDISKGKEQNNV